MKEQKNVTYYKRNLPHYQPEGSTFFITFRLAGSLPVEVILQLKEDREKELKFISDISSHKQKTKKYYEYQRRYFGVFDKLLDSYKNSPMWLEEREIAELVIKEINIRDEKDYELIAYTIMPNHVHMVFTPISKSVGRSEASTKSKTTNEANASFYIVTKILQDLKSKTALKCNKLLNRTGVFWHHESYDHVVRNLDELRRIVNYILQNPVKAGLVENPDDWEWSYYNPKYFV
jgi:REP element-mobilizing transposase RayT